MTSDTLLEHYYEFSIEGETLIPFIRRVLAGDYGVPERRPILHFLDTLEAIILGNIDARFEEGPGLEADPDAVAEETRREVDEARTLVMRTLPHD